MIKLNKVSIVATFIVILGLVGLNLTVGAATSVNLGAADDFVVLADTAISDATPTGLLTGDVGLGPTSGGASITGLTSAQVSGTIYAMDAAGPDGAAGDNPAIVGAAKTALTNAYLNAEAQTLPSVTTVTASLTNSFDITGTTLAPGIYKSPSTMGITGTLTLNGSATDVWVFQAGSTLTTAADTNIVLTGGAQACNVFWQVGSSATLGTNTLFKGNVLAFTSITDSGGSIVQGRLLARNGAVSLNNTTVVKATCVVPPVAPSGGGGSPSVPLPVPLIGVIKVPTPLALPSGPGPVTYNYTVSNLGTVPINRINVTDNKCDAANIMFVSGDVNDNEILEVNETWRYSCTTTLSETTTNTVTVRGEANSFTAIDTANATVVVGVPGLPNTGIMPPLIHLVKKPNIFVRSTAGPVIYAYTITNPGEVALENVSLVDDKCAPISGRSGDVNNNNMLDVSEAWTYTCQTNLAANTVNTATAQGNANGLTAIDFALATVVVTPPRLPNTGVTPEERNALIITLVGVLAASFFYYLSRRKQTAN